MIDSSFEPIPPGVAVRVRPPHSHAGMGVLWFALGAFSGAALQAILRSNVVPMWWVQMTAVLIAPAIVCVYLARCCQHARACFGIGAVFGLGLGGGMLSSFLYCEPLRLASMGVLDLVIVLGAILLFGAVVGGGALAARAAWVHGRSVVRTQDGTLCPVCAYIIASAPDAECCSECGLPLPAQTRGHGPLMRLANGLGASHFTRGAVVLGLVAIMTVVPVFSGRDVLRFRRHVAGGRSAAVMYGSSAPLEKWVEVVLPQSTDKIRLLAEYHIPDEIGAYIRVVAWTADGLQFASELDARQTRLALDNGLPAGLIDKVVDAARRGATSDATVANSPTCVFVKIDAAEFFPK